MNSTTDRILNAACTPGLPHGAFRLYAILSATAQAKDSVDAYFTVTLAGLMELHPGVGGQSVGVTTLLKQAQELRRLGLLEIRGALHRNDTRVPVVVRVLPPQSPTPDAAGIAETQ